MSVTIADKLVTLRYDGSLAPLVGGHVYAVPSYVPLLVNGQLLSNPKPEDISDTTGSWSIVLPWQSESSPSNVTWQIVLPDGTIYSGIAPPAVSGPYTIAQLVASWGWGLVSGSATTTVTAIQGPAGSGMVWKGAWSGATAYNVGDGVSLSGSSYICILAHTNHTPPNATYWNLIAAAGATGATGAAGAAGATGAAGPAGLTWRGAWNSGTTYAINDAVSLGGSSYIAILGSTNQTPPNATYWNVLAQQGSAGTGMANPMTTTGDVIYSSDGVGTPARLAIGSARFNLAVNAAGTLPAYQASLQSLMTTTGDVVYASSANTPARLGIGSGYQNLSANSGATALTYQASLQSLMTTTGDVLYASAANTPARLGIGAAYQNLGVNSAGTLPAYQASLQSLMTGTGDLVTSSGANTPARLAIGTAFQHLGVNSGATALTYQSSLQSLMTTTGDIVYASSANTPARLAIGAAGTALVGGTIPSWGSPYAIGRGGGTFSLDANGHLITTATALGTPTNTAANANTSISVTGNDICGSVTFTTAATTTSGTQVRVVFGTAYSSAPTAVLLMRNNTGSSGVASDIGAVNISTTGFEVSTKTQPVVSTTLTYGFLVIQ